MLHILLYHFFHKPMGDFTLCEKLRFLQMRVWNFAYAMMATANIYFIWQRWENILTEFSDKTTLNSLILRIFSKSKFHLVAYTSVSMKYNHFLLFVRHFVSYFPHFSKTTTTTTLCPRICARRVDFHSNTRINARICLAFY